MVILKFLLHGSCISAFLLSCASDFTTQKEKVKFIIWAISQIMLSCLEMDKEEPKKKKSYSNLFTNFLLIWKQTLLQQEDYTN